jgi:hypothetical protein
MDHAERPKIDRIACPWLISFIDAQAQFHYVPADAWSR